MEIEPKDQGELIVRLEDLLTQEVNLRQRMLSYLKQEECALSISDLHSKQDLLETTLSLCKHLQSLFKERQHLIGQILASYHEKGSNLEILRGRLGEAEEIILTLYERQQNLALESQMQHLRNKNLESILERSGGSPPSHVDAGKIDQRGRKILVIEGQDDLSDV